jgi:hypothetical protein
MGQHWAATLVLAAGATVSAAPALADPAPAAAGGSVALLPLDADARLEIYGQPVASELAHALIAGGIEVVVVGPRMAVPDSATLIVDGTITARAADAVSLAVRVRERKTGAVLAKLDASAPSLTQIDRAAADLAARVLPSVRTQLAAIDRAGPRTARGEAPRGAPPPSSASAMAPPPPRGVTVTVGPGALHDALQSAFAVAADRHHFPIGTEAGVPAIVLETFAYTVEAGPVALARARVHVRVSRATETLFDRVVITDTVVGDRGLADDQLAARTARAVLDILEPHLRRAIEGWR